LAEEMREELEAEEAKESPKPSGKKRRTSGRRLRTGLLLLLGGLGVLLGFHVAGLVDARAVVFPALSRLPVVGPRLAPHLPAEFRMTAAERRALELLRREMALNRRAEELLELERRLKALSEDLEGRLARISRDEEEAAKRLSSLLEEIARLEGKLSASRVSEEEIRRVVAYFEGMRTRSAADVLSQMEDALAARILRALPPDRASSILSRMDPARAAAISRIMMTEEGR